MVTRPVTLSAPTTSPREFVSGASARPSEFEPELIEERGERRPERALRSVLDLERDAEAVARGAQQSLGPALRHPAARGA